MSAALREGRQLPATWLGRRGYEDMLAAMHRARERVLAGESGGELFLCEHPPVVTRGRSSQAANLLVSPDELARQGVALVDIERGGDVTYHGPGQLMIYPVVRVGIAVSRFLETIASTLGELAASYGVEGARWRRDEAGLWLGERKMAACGLHLHRGVSIHGFAFNVCTPPAAWHCIVPCGLTGPGPISLREARAERGLQGDEPSVEAPSVEAPSVEDCATRALPMLQAALLSYLPAS